MTNTYILDWLMNTDKYVILNQDDNSLVKSQGIVLEFDTAEEAEKVRDYLEEQIGLIKEASRIWYSREKDEDDCFVLRKFVMEE